MIKRIALVFLICLMLVLSACEGDSNLSSVYYDTEPVKEIIINACTELGLTNITVNITERKMYDDYKFCYKEVHCDGFSTLSGEKKYKCFSAIDSASPGGLTGSKITSLDSDITIISDGHKYTYEEGSKSTGRSGYIYRDGTKAYEKEFDKNSNTTTGTTGTINNTTDSGARHTNAEAFTCAQAIVESYLKSPSTAKFCKVTEATITNSGDKYTVKGWVDAQNSFGATIRQNFTVTYTATEKGYKNGSCTFS